MVGAVEALHPEIDQRVARYHAALRRLLHPPVDGRDVLVGNHPAHDLVHKLVARAPGPRGHPDPAVAVLSPPAGLLLVLALSLRLALDRLAIRHPRPGQLGVHPELALQPVEDGVEVALTHAVDERLPQLGAVLEVKGRVFLVELVEAGGKLVLFAPLLHQHRGCGHRVGQRDGGEAHRLVPLAEGIAGVRVTKLGHGSDVARRQPFHLDPVLALLDREVVELLRYFVLRIPHLVPVSQLARYTGERASRRPRGARSGS